MSLLSFSFLPPSPPPPPTPTLLLLLVHPWRCPAKDCRRLACAADPVDPEALTVPDDKGEAVSAQSDLPLPTRKAPRESLPHGDHGAYPCGQKSGAAGSPRRSSPVYDSHNQAPLATRLRFTTCTAPLKLRLGAVSGGEDGAVLLFYLISIVVSFTSVLRPHHSPFSLAPLQQQDLEFYFSPSVLY